MSVGVSEAECFTEWRVKMSLGNLFLIFYFRNLACGTGLKNSIKRYIELLIQYSRVKIGDCKIYWFPINYIDWTNWRICGCLWILSDHVVSHFEPFLFFKSFKGYSISQFILLIDKVLHGDIHFRITPKICIFFCFSKNSWPLESSMVSYFSRASFSSGICWFGPTKKFRESLGATSSRTLGEVAWFRRDGDQKQHPPESHCMVYSKDSPNIAKYIMHGIMNEFIGEKNIKS